MRWLAILSVLMLLSGVPLGQAQNGCTALTIDFGNESCQELDVHLEGDRGSTITFQAPESAFEGPGGTNLTGHNADTAALTLTCPCPIRTESITLTMQRNAGTDTWSAAMPVNDPRLIAGTWLVRAQAVQGPATYQTPSASMVVAAPDVGDLRVRALNPDETGTVNVGAGQQVQIAILHAAPSPAPLVRSVTYQIGSNAAFDWAAPYALPAEAFQPAGRHQMTVTVEDRLGQSQTVGFAVYADTVDPVVAPTTPQMFYRGIPNHVDLVVSEHSPYTATARVAGVQDSAAGAGQSVVRLSLQPVQLGDAVLEMIVTDKVGNTVRLLEQTRVEALRTDIVLVEAVQSNPPAIPGEPVTLKVVARQIDGLADVPVNVSFGGVLLGQMTVNRTQPSEMEFEVEAPTGQTTADVVLTVSEHVNELNQTNQMGNATVERFLARVVHGADRYHIRAGGTGLPYQAVGLNGTTFPLRLQDRGVGTVYAFEADGNDLYWHPASTVTVVPEEEPGDGENGIPGLPVAALFAALVAVARRRR